MHVFLTGATGLLGSELVARLSQRPEIASVRCLVRAKGGLSPGARLDAALAFHPLALPTHKVHAVSGDLADRDLEPQLAGDPTLRDIDVVVNAAANTSFLAQNAAAIEEANVAGLERLLRWSRGLPRLRTFLQVSTAAVAGAARTSQVVSESDDLDPAAPQVVAYTASKLRAERLVRQHLPAERVLIARPSIVMGDARGWRPRAPVVLWAMAAINRLRLVPVAAHGRLDVVPVDHAADAITRLLFASRRYDVYHVSSGHDAATSPAELARLLAEHFPEFPDFLFLPKSQGVRLRRWIGGRASPEFAGLESYLNFWARTLGDPRRALSLIAALEPYFRFMELDQVFDAGRLQSDTGLAPCAPAHVYLRGNMAHLGEIDVIAGARDP